MNIDRKNADASLRWDLSAIYKTEADFAADCERLLEGAEREVGHKIDPDIIILDPPRAGCDEKLIRFVSSLEPKRIVYISCNPKTLARDVEIFMSLGFEASGVTPVDLFPCTGHVESVVCLTRQSDVI